MSKAIGCFASKDGKARYELTGTLATLCKCKPYPEQHRMQKQTLLNWSDVGPAEFCGWHERRGNTAPRQMTA